MVEENQAEPSIEQVSAVLVAAASGQLPREPPADPLAVADRLQLYWKAATFCAEGGGPPAPGALLDAVERLRAALRCDQALADLMTSIEQAEGQPAAVAAYLLQAAEGGLRPVVEGYTALDGGRQAQVERALQRLRQASEQVSEAALRLEGERLYGAFLQGCEEPLRLVRGWQPGDAGEGCRAQIARLGALLDRAQSLGQRLGDEGSRGQLSGLARELNELLVQASAAQQARYNQWAMEAIEHGWRACLEHTGLLTDEKKLGQALVEHFGRIDTRLLQHEVSRCYTEAFEFLFQHLGAPKDKDSFQKEGQKLYVLKRIFETSKRDLGDF